MMPYGRGFDPKAIFLSRFAALCQPGWITKGSSFSSVGRFDVSRRRGQGELEPRATMVAPVVPANESRLFPPCFRLLTCQRPRGHGRECRRPPSPSTPPFSFAGSGREQSPSNPCTSPPPCRSAALPRIPGRAPTLAPIRCRFRGRATAGAEICRRSPSSCSPPSLPWPRSPLNTTRSRPWVVSSLLA